MAAKAASKSNLSDGTTWRSRYQLAVRTQERMFVRFASWYDLMYAHINTSQYALWRSKVFLPIIPSKGWAMVAKLTGMNPGFEVGLYGEALNNPDSQQNAEKAQWKLEHDWDNPMFDELMRDKLLSPLVDALVTGTGLAKIPWTFTNNVRYEKLLDEETGEVDTTQDVKIEKATGYNDLIPVDIMSTFIQPGAKNLQSAAWVILEDWVTYDQLKAENDSAGGDMYSNLDQVKELKADSDQFARQKQSRSLLITNEDPVTVDQTVRQFKRLECYEKSSGHRFVYAVGKDASGAEEGFIELYNKKLPYWHGKYPLVAFYTKRRPFSFWGQGIFEDTERMQSAFNDIFNHYMDNLNLSLDGMVMKQQGEEYSYIVQPGGEFIYKDEPPKQFKFPEPNPAQFNVIMNFIEAQVEAVTIPQVATGATQPGKTDPAQSTATGISKLQEMAGDKIGFMKQQYASSMREIGKQWMSNNQQFMDEPFTLMGQVNNRPGPVTIQPQDLQGEFAVRINDASMEPLSQAEQLEQFDTYVTQIQTLAKASFEQAMTTRWNTTPVYIDFASLIQDLSQKMGQNNFDKIVMNGTEIDQKLGPLGELGLIMPKDSMKIDLDELYGSEATQVLQRMGVQADPGRANQVPVDSSGNPMVPADRLAADQMGLAIYGRATENDQAINGAVGQPVPGGPSSMNTTAPLPPGAPTPAPPYAPPAQAAPGAPPQQPPVGPPPMAPVEAATNQKKIGILKRLLGRQ